MDIELPNAVDSIDSLDKDRLEQLKDRCGRQVIIRATTDGNDLEKHRREIDMCSILVNRYGKMLLEDINK